MSSLSTFGTFTMARLGIFAAQHALNTTGNNISNINTKGYTRQQLDQTSMTYGAADRYQSINDLRSNGGVLATGINQMRDQYLDIRYRNEMTRVGEMEEKLDGLSQLAVVFDEVGKGEDGEGVLEARFNDLTQQLETMLQDYNVGRNTNDSIVREAAEALTIQFNDYAKQLEVLEANQLADFKSDISDVNTSLNKIRDLNEAIRRAQIFGGSALTQLDERNLLIDELAKKIGINVTYETESMGDGVEVEKLKITTSGEPPRTLIDGIYGAQIGIKQILEQVPRTDQDGNPVRDANGVQIQDWVVKDDPNYKLTISELQTAKGKYEPTQPNDLTGETLIETVGDKDSWNSEALQGKIRKLTFSTPAEALAYENKLNEQFGYPTSGERENPGTFKTPYFHLSRTEYGDAGTTYVLHYHGSGNTETDAEKDYSYVNIDKFQQTELSDTELTGGLQAKREMLTEVGEYTTANTETTKQNDPLNYDPDAGTKRGIPYYRKALDTLANAFARAMNEANALTNEIAYQTTTEGDITKIDDYDAVDVSKDALYRDDKAIVSILGSDGATYTRDTTTGKYIRTITYDNNGTKTVDVGEVREELVKQFFKPTEEFAKYFTETAYTKADTTGNGRVAGKFYDEVGNELVMPDGFKVPDDQTEIVTYTVKRDAKQYFGGNLFSVSGTSDLDGNSGNEGDDTKITAANITISHAWAHGELHVLRSIDPDADSASRKSDNLVHIVSMLGEKHEFTSGASGLGATYFKGTFQEMLTDTIAGTLAKDGNITGTMLNNYNATADTLYVDRDAVMGVDLNDEAMNMMQFQKAYSAACRLMTTYDEMLERLINGTAV